VRSPALKRLLDIAGAGTALVVASPALAGISLAVWMDVGCPVLFRQQRPGLGGVPFHMIKFRTMRQATSGDGTLLSDEQRLTSLGKLLRATSLDELPELWNVLRGSMSLVGPRPLLMQYLARYSPEQRRRHEVKPGITGWAQVHGRNALSWEEKFAHDVWYVDHWSNELDLSILVRTITAVLFRRGISHAGDATMHEFMGSV
jgi:lipopolysaccharide/colanic/teichoic acid biosynthesis glycosyltransferase